MPPVDSAVRSRHAVESDPWTIRSSYRKTSIKRRVSNKRRAPNKRLISNTLSSLEGLKQHRVVRVPATL